MKGLQCVAGKQLWHRPSDSSEVMTVVQCVFVPWFTDQVNLDESGSQSRQGLLGLESPSVKHIPSMLHVLSWQEKKR